MKSFFSWLGSFAFIQKIANTIGTDQALKFFEERYLYYRDSDSRRVFLTYNTGRVDFKEDPRRVLKFYNDGKTKPSEDTIRRARNHFIQLTQGVEDEDKKVRKIAQWVNDTTVYSRDSDRWGSPEYWSSPFDLWAEFEDTGKIRDDCDGYAVIMWWGCRLIGIPSQRIFIWAGNARRNGSSDDYGHANLLYDPLTGFKHIEGSFYAKDNISNWLKYKKGCSRYPETWFFFNDQEIRRS